MTAHQLANQRERELAEQEQQAAQRALETKRMVAEDAYAAAIEVENRNRRVAGAAAVAVPHRQQLGWRPGEQHCQQKGRVTTTVCVCIPPQRRKELLERLLAGC